MERESTLQQASVKEQEGGTPAGKTTQKKEPKERDPLEKKEPSGTLP